MTAQAQAEGCNTLITCGGVQSNHCRATALVAAQLGMQSHLILRGDHPDELDGNLLLDYLAGAQISCYSRAQFSRELPELIHHWQDHYANRGDKAFAIPIGASDGIGVWGYIGAAEELANDMSEAGIDTAYWVAATGSGGTQAGLTAGVVLHDMDSRIIGIAVCDDAEYFQRKVRADIARWQRLYGIDIEPDDIPINVDDRFIGPGYAQAGPEVFSVIQDIAALEGLILDPVYTGKAFHGMIEKIKAGEFAGESDIVFVHTGGIFGLMAQRDFLNLSVTKL